jgi:TolB-like protein/DNA-binding winged helix-turn-helix (wHTH) protein/Tfp pilus assembly protein PilF
VNHTDQRSGVLRFDSFELELSSGELRKSGALIKLQALPFQLLVLLVERGGKVVTREEIRQALWDEDTFVDFDRSINFCVNQIRDALGDDPQNPRYIKTLPRRGYCFVAPATESGGESPKAGTASVPVPVSGPVAVSERVTVSKPARPMRFWLMIAAAVAVIAVIAGLARLSLRRNPEVKPIRSLAVLPLENLSRDPEQEYFADGLTDDLITSLAKIRTLRVISRTSIMQYKGTKKSVPQIAQELNVDAVLEGTVARDRDQVRITTQLISAIPEKHLWAEKYEASLSNVLSVQDQVANEVARAIQINLTPQEQLQLTTPRVVNPDAYEDYLKGRYLGGFPDEENLIRSREYFERAIEMDPGYALAWAGLGTAYTRLANWGVLPSQDTRPRARAAAEKALELDGTLVEPLVTLADVKMNYEWDWAGTERLLKLAIELSPNDGEAHHVYATYLAEMGRTQEAVAEARRAREVEPLSIEYAVNVVWKLYLARRYQEAELENRRITEWYPQFTGDYILASVYLQTGRQREAVALLQRGVAESNHSVLELMYLGHALGVSGHRAGAHRLLEEMQQISQRRNVPPEYIAIVYEGLGERDHALQWFERAYKERSMNGWILPDQRLDAIRSDPRFQDIMRRMRLLK